MGSGGNGGAVPDAPRSAGVPPRVRFKLAGLILGTVLLLAALSFGGYKLLHKNAAPVRTTSAKTPALTSQDRVQSYLIQKNYAAAASIYNDQLKAAKTADQKAQANMGLCGVYTAEQNYPLAYQYALKAYTDEATEQTAVTAADAAKNAGNKADAAKYYQLAINLLPKENQSPDVQQYVLRQLQADLREVGQ